MVSLTLAACGGGGGGGGGADLPRLAAPRGRPIVSPLTTRVTFNIVEGAASYVLYVRSGNAEAVPTNPLITVTQPAEGSTAEMNWSSLNLQRAPMNHQFAVKAIAPTGNDATHSDSVLSLSSLPFHIDRDRIATPKKVDGEDGLDVSGLEVEWGQVTHATSYAITVLRDGSTVPIHTHTNTGHENTTIDLWSPYDDVFRLEPGHKYTVRVVAHPGSGDGTRRESLAAEVEIDLTSFANVRLDAPAQPTVADQTLTWTAITGAKAYRIDVVGANMPSRIVGAVTTFDLNEFRLPVATGYNVRISALGIRANESTFSPSRPFDISEAHVDAPSALTIDTTADIRSLSWTRSNTPGLIEHRIEHRTVTGPGPWVKGPTLALTGSPPSTITFDLLSLGLAGGEYNVRVVSVFSNGIEAPSAPSGLFTIIQTLPVPADVTITGDKLSWTIVEGATAYELWVGVGGGAPALTAMGTIGTDGDTRTFDLSSLSLAPGNHSIQLRAVGTNPTLVHSELTGIQWFVVPA
jgi:hypothetical protein